MEWDVLLDILQDLLLEIGFFAFLAFLMWFFLHDRKYRKSPKLSGPATVISLSAELKRGWQYTATFQLKDGEELQLTTLRYWYETLKEGQTGWLTWKDETLVDFEPDT